MGLDIDWRLILFQVANFLLLLFVLKRFLYRPVLNMIEKRQQSIQDAEAMRKDLEMRMQEIEKQQQEILKQTREESQGILAKAQQQGQEMAQQIERQAKAKAEDIIVHGKQDIEIMRKSLQHELRQEVAEVALKTAEAVLGSQVSADQKKDIIKEAVRRFTHE